MRLAAVFLLSLSLVMTESVGIACLTYWAKKGCFIAWICGMYSFVFLAGLLGFTIRIVGHMNTVNILWQSMSIVSLFAISVLGYHEPLQLSHMMGAIMAIGAGVCFSI